jgi:AcrR family transcriptional regulator
MINNDEPQKIKRNTKDTIIEVAIDLFSENGVSAVSIRDIAKQVGINQSSVYNHFKSKDELLEVIFDKFKKELGRASFPEEGLEEQIAITGPELFLQNHLLRLRERITSTIQKIWKIIYIEQFRDKRARDIVLYEIIAVPAAYYEKAFTIMMEKGLIKTIDAKVVADEYNYTLFSLSLERMLLQTDNQDVMPTVRKMFEHIKFICDAIRK